MNAADKANRRNLSKFGSYVRQRARSLIKKAPQVDVATGLRLGPGRRQKGVKTRDAISDPGAPPYGHVGYVRQFLYFAYDAATSSVVIGPERFGKGTVGALESGGTITIGPRGRRQGRQVTLQARPFMKPAFDAELPRVSDLWKDSILP
jgi:hypothetical protein